MAASALAAIAVVSVSGFFDREYSLIVLPVIVRLRCVSLNGVVLWFVHGSFNKWFSN